MDGCPLEYHLLSLLSTCGDFAEYERSLSGGLNNLLFGDILAVRPADLVMSGMLCALVGTFILLTLRVQLLITVNEALAVARGAAVGIQRLLFITLLALVVAVSIKTVGVLLISAFVVIPACGARLWSRQFSQYVVLAAW